MALCLAPVEPGALDHPLDPLWAVQGGGLGPGEPQRCRQQRDVLVLRAGPGKQRVDLAGRLADREQHWAEWGAEVLALALGVEHDVAALLAGCRNPAHHHRQHRLVIEPDPAFARHRDGAIIDDRGVGRVERGVEIERQLARIDPAHIDGRAQADVGERRVAARPQIAQPLFEVEQAVDPPEPLPAIVEHRARIVPELGQPRAACVECGRVGCGVLTVRHVRRSDEAIVRCDQLRIAARPGIEQRQFRLVLAAAGADLVYHQFDIVALLQGGQHLLGKMRIGVVILVEIFDPVRRARLAPGCLGLFPALGPARRVNRTVGN